MTMLIGISKGVIADGIVNQDEAESILEWMAANEQFVLENPEIDRLFGRISRVLEDGFLDRTEAAELVQALRTFAGDRSEMGEMLKSSLPVDDPEPVVVFRGKVFKFSGQHWEYGSKKQCEDQVGMRYGRCIDDVTRELDYYVICRYADPRWKYGTRGGKLEKAVKYRDKYGKPAIISEDHFIKALKSTS